MGKRPSGSVKTSLNLEIDQLEEKPRNIYEELPDAQLAVLARQKDPKAFDMLMRRYQKKAFTVAYLMSGSDTETAKDLTQQAFLNTFRSIQKFRADSSFYTWFYRILINTCIDDQRRRKRREQYFSFRSLLPDGGDDREQKIENFPNPGQSGNPLRLLDSKELYNEVKSALNTLSEKQRCAFQLKVFQEMSISEISAIMKTAPGSVKSHLFRATQSLRSALAAWRLTDGRG
jgi:RNA polymerase sigma-70 factor (ECF subfamily)